MKLSDLDNESRRLIYMASIYVRRQDTATFAKLCEAVESFRDKHEQEMIENFMAAVFPKKKEKSNARRTNPTRT